MIMIKIQRRRAARGGPDLRRASDEAALGVRDGRLGGHRLLRHPDPEPIHLRAVHIGLRLEALRKFLALDLGLVAVCARLRL